MDFHDVSLTQFTNADNSVDTNGIQGVLSIDIDARKIVMNSLKTGKQIFYETSDLFFSTKSRIGEGDKLCLTRSRDSSLSEDLVKVLIEGACREDTDTIFEAFTNLRWGASRKTVMGLETSIATLTAIAQCKKCGRGYGTVVKCMRAPSTTLVDYTLTPCIGQCGHVVCGVCVDDAGAAENTDTDIKGKRLIPCPVCPTSTKGEWFYCQSFSDLVAKVPDITTHLERSKDHERIQAEAVRIQKELQMTLLKAQEDHHNAVKERDEFEVKCKQSLEEKEVIIHQKIADEVEMNKKVATLQRQLAAEKKKKTVPAKDVDDQPVARGECAKCKLNEKTERLHICLGCARTNGVMRGEGEKEMAPFILCAVCFLNDHGDHFRLKYSDEIRRLIVSATEETETFVASIDKAFVEVISKNHPSFGDWVKNLGDKKTLKFDTMTYKEAKEICDEIVKDREVVKKAVEKTIADLDKFGKSFEKRVTDKNRKRKSH